MDLVSRSMILRAAVSVGLVAFALWAFRSIAAAAAALALARMSTLLLYDLPASEARIERPHSAQAVMRSALPLGVVLMLTSLTSNMPRYAIERHLGTRELGIFAAVASFITVGSTIVNALGQSATTRLATHFESDRKADFRRLAWRLAGIAVALGGVGILVALAAGDFFLSVIYRPEYGVYKNLLAAVLAAGTLSYVAIMLGYAITSTRTFTAQMPLLAAVIIACAAASFLAVPAMGLPGAALALGVAAGVQIVGQLVILARLL